MPLQNNDAIIQATAFKPNPHSIAHSLLEHALLSGFIEREELPQLTPFLDAEFDETFNGAPPILVELSDRLPRKQVHELWAFYNNWTAPLGSNSDSRCQDFTRQLKAVTKAQPRFSPTFDLSLDRKEKIGEGGMGLVYRVSDRVLGRDAALKTLNDDAAQFPELIQRFVQEAEITASLDHPSIPPVYEAGTNSRGQHCLLMRIIGGQSLNELIQRLHHSSNNGETHSHTMTTCLRVLVKISAAVAYAHSQNVIHRDITPRNIIVGRHGGAMLMDWGLAKRIDENSPDSDVSFKRASPQTSHSTEIRTQVGAIMGTPGYMSPEQFQDSSAVGKDADIFALAAILTEILTGHCPLPASADPFQSYSSTELRTPRDILPTAPRELDSLAKATLKGPVSERLGSAEEFGRQLNAFLNGEEVTSHRYSLKERILRSAQRRSGLLLLTPVLALFALSFGFVTRDYYSRKSQLDAKQTLATSASRATRRFQESMAWFQLAEKQAQWAEDRHEIRHSVEQALKLRQRDTLGLLTAAKIFDKAELLDETEALLKEATTKDQAAYEALFYLHKLRTRRVGRGVQFTPPLRELIDRSQKAGVENEFTLFAAATECLTQARHKEALDLLNKVEAYSTQFATAYCSRGYAHSKLGDQDAAVSDYSRAIQLDPRYEAAFYNRGIVLARLDRFDEALVDYNQAIKLDGRKKTRFVNRGNILAKLGRFEEALEDFNTALSLDPKMALAYVNRASTYLQLGKKQPSLEDYNRALELNPNLHNARNDRAQLLADMGQFEEALREFNEVLKKAPQSPAAYNNRGNVKRRLGKLNEALLDYQLSLKYNSQSAITLFNMGVTNALLGNYDQALNDLTKSIKLDPEHTQSFFHRALVHHECRRLEEAKSDYDQTLKLDPKFSTAYHNRALVRNMLGDTLGAINDYTKAIKLEPKDVDSIVSRADLYQKLGRLDESKLDCALAIKVDPRFAKAYDLRAYLRRHTGDPEGAVRDLERLIVLSPHTVRSYLLCAGVRQEMGDRKGAIDVCRRGLIAIPNSLPLILTRADNYARLGQDKEALDDYDLAVKIAPEQAMPFFARGQFFRNRGQYSKARLDWRAALQWARNPQLIREIKRRLSALNRPEESDEN